MDKQWPFFLAGLPTQSVDRHTVMDKFMHEPAGHVDLASQDDIKKAFSMAYRSRAETQKNPAWKRKKFLEHVTREIDKRSEELSYTLAIEVGKPIKDARVEVQRLRETLQISAEEAVRLDGAWLPLDHTARGEGYEAVVRRFPAGVASLITPFNFPLNLAAHKIGPAIAAGLPWVMKPSLRTPLSSVLLGEMLAAVPADFALPAGSWSILPSSDELAPLFSTDPHIAVISFTGSPAIGWRVKQTAPRAKVLLELGGNAACLLDEGIELTEQLISKLVFSAMYQSGQSCVSLQRLYVHKSQFEQCKAALVAQLRGLRIGDPLAEDTYLG